MGIDTLSKINEKCRTSPDIIKHQPYYHIILLAKNQAGLKNLYKLVSYSHIDYFYKKPRLPWSLIEKHREGLIIGSACVYGEVYSSLIEEVYYNKRTGQQGVNKAATYEEQEKILNNSFKLENPHLEIIFSIIICEV